MNIQLTMVATATPISEFLRRTSADVVREITAAGKTGSSEDTDNQAKVYADFGDVHAVTAIEEAGEEADDGVAAECRKAGTDGHVEKRSAAEQILCDKQHSGPFGGIDPALRHAALRFEDREPDNKCQQQARHANDEESLTPTDIVRNPTAGQVGNHDADRNAAGINSHRGRAFLRRVIVGNYRVRRRAAACLPNADPDSCQRQLADTRCGAAKCGHAAPYCQGNGNQVAPVPAIGNQCDRNTERCIKNSKGRPGERPEYPIVDTELGFYRGQQNRKDLPVDEIARIDHHEYTEDIASRRLRS